MKKPKTKSHTRRRNPETVTAKDRPTRPVGKLGLIVDQVERKAGATTDELTKMSGWQRHSVLGALSRLRARGFAIHLDVQGSRKAYRLRPER